jgi:hypothetical protein
VQLRDSGVEWEYEGERLEYTTSHIYIPDFRIGDMILEFKGYFDAAARRKMLNVRRCYPELDIRFVFQNAANKISRKGLTYGGWATRNGFPWCNGNINKEWLK